MVVGQDLKPGDEVQSWCTKCREMRLHNVKALVEGKVPRVICRTCDGEHNFRPNPPKSKQKGTAKSRRKKGEAEPNPWKELMVDADISKARDYTIHERFAGKEVMNHRKYGIGIVIEVLDATKMAVAFEDKRRILVCNK